MLTNRTVTAGVSRLSCRHLCLVQFQAGVVVVVLVVVEGVARCTWPMAGRNRRPSERSALTALNRGPLARQRALRHFINMTVPHVRIVAIQ